MCLLDEKLKAVDTVYLVSMTKEVKQSAKANSIKGKTIRQIQMQSV